MTPSPTLSSPTLAWPRQTHALRLADALMIKTGLHRADRAGRPPGPSPLSDLALVPLYFSGQLRYMQILQQTWGDVVFTRVGPYTNITLHDPALIEEVLLRQHERFQKDVFTAMLKPIVGQGLLTSEGELWRKQRKLAAPKLQKKQITAYAQAMVWLTEQACDRWTAHGPTRRPLSQDMMELTLLIVTQTLFGMSAHDIAHEVGDLIDRLMAHFDREFHSPLLLVPPSIRTPTRRAFDADRAKLDEVLRRMIAQRRAGEPGDDLLWRLIHARDEDGSPMPDAQLRDEAITMFLAGHETTSLAITYTWDLLTRHPDAMARLVREVDQTLQGRPATVEAMSQLPWTRAVIQESMRLYPPAWIIGRQAREPVELGPWRVEPGAQLLISPWLLHRDARWFERPTRFEPERWLDGQLEASLPRYAYMPFGGGPRVCIGNHFAMMELILVVATMAQRLTITREDDSPLQLATSVTLRPAKPVELLIAPRAASAP